MDPRMRGSAMGERLPVQFYVSTTTVLDLRYRANRANLGRNAYVLLLPSTNRRLPLGGWPRAFLARLQRVLGAHKRRTKRGQTFVDICVFTLSKIFELLMSGVCRNNEVYKLGTALSRARS